jgi:hypothetical protein
MLAEGGEGRVFEVLAGPSRLGPALVYKELCQPRPRSELDELVAFPGALRSAAPGLSARVASSAAWPLSAVTAQGTSLAVGAVMPRAPERFWLRHRDKLPRLATLGYLTSDPDRIAAAYGVTLPPPGAPERVALVYALARLLEAWQAAAPRVVHGDLSAKNVLWSLAPAPAVYVLDCDDAAVTDLVPTEAAPVGVVAGGVRTGPSDGLAEGDPPPGAAAGSPQVRPRATTPNWDDPALPAGDRPDELVDRYALGLVFLRVVGAAHFPLQARQRVVGERVSIDLEVPRSWRRLSDMPALWELCARSLSVVEAASRPSPTDWAAQLQLLLKALGRPELAASARAAQGDLLATEAPAPLPVAPPLPGDVEVRPVLAHRPPSTWRLISAAPPLMSLEGETKRQPGAAAGGPRQAARRTLRTWAGAHGLAGRLLRSRGRRLHGLRRLAGLFALDLVAACVALFVGAMIVSPWIGL